MTDPPRPRQGVHRVDTLDTAATTAELVLDGWKVFVLPGHEIDDRPTFFAAVASLLPLAPPLKSHRSWAALSDSLREGLHTAEWERVAVLWPGSIRMSEGEPRDFDRALTVLRSVAKSLSSAKATVGEPMSLYVLVQ